jgi:hypothetical protein
MQSLSAAELLDVWEQGLGQLPVERALALLAAAEPDTPGETFAQLSIGQRDGQLLSLREKIFGQDIVALTNCPKCNELLETNLRSSDIRIPRDLDLPEPLSLKSQDYTVRFRLPNSQDLIEISDVRDSPSLKNILIGRCILQVRQGDLERTPEQLPGEVVEAILKRMDESDPLANIYLNLCCPACAHEWHEQFDILGFFWNEIDDWANRTLDAIHLIASAYGWSESEILSLGTMRRQIYLEKVVE